MPSLSRIHDSHKQAIHAFTQLFGCFSRIVLSLLVTKTCAANYVLKFNFASEHVSKAVSVTSITMPSAVYVWQTVIKEIVQYLLLLIVAYKLYPYLKYS